MLACAAHDLKIFLIDKTTWKDNSTKILRSHCKYNSNIEIRCAFTDMIATAFIFTGAVVNTTAMIVDC